MMQMGTYTFLRVALLCSSVKQLAFSDRNGVVMTLIILHE